MLNPLEDKGLALWREMPRWKRLQYRLSRVKPDARLWVKVLIAMAYWGDEKAQAAMPRLFITTRRGARKEFLPRGCIAMSNIRRFSVPVLFETFIGVNGRKF